MNVYEIVTDEIVKLLEAGTVPWLKPWTNVGPRNLVSGKSYRGVNVLLLAGAPYASSYWLTYKQCDKLGGQVRKGERSRLITFWTQLQDKVDPDKRHFLLRYFRVFNVEQCDNLDYPAESALEVEPHVGADALIAAMPNRPSISHSGTSAYYVPALDTITLPARESFVSADAYYATLLHELTHSTGHKSRCDREDFHTAAAFGSEIYSREELVAELGSAMLCGVVGIDTTRENSAAYIASWLKALRNDSKLIVQAASKAQAAADFIRGIDHSAAAEVVA